MPELWGVLNVTPDSFSDGGKFLKPAQAIEHGRTLLQEGADVLDVGGESSRPAGRTYGPGFEQVPAAEEVRRVVPVIEALAGRLGAQVSIDTVKPEVAAAALAAGATVVNDVHCAEDPALAEAAAAKGAEYVIMHNRGRGEVRSPNIDYGNVVEEVLAELLAAAERVEGAGVPRASIWLDPGLGFAKTAAQSTSLLSSLGRFRKTGYRVLVGPSRKSFIAELAPNPGGEPPPADARLGGTAAAVAMCVAAGVDAVRVHDVFVMRQVIRVTEALRDAGGGAR
ncbi:MAG: dihydropteroate synthase [Deltaproteobacteria bacterium]|nr:dihydropteroate synthase [Deltaproteobacteria bacterium]NND28283.1 dihydropteroate synthase [Myxococcales bacterium]MBT8463165.1 dihydropteroate synthase [Deltaproteobacteria bacterium]MBT8482364.1 dihydropteroate synthase [Deltaproteobacteria bacterium]NNK06999.1 dihydropteroate synthase [Myxococcales bacterium]